MFWITSMLSLTVVSISSMAIFVTHPVSLVAIILSQTLTICLLTFILHQTAWFSIVIFLIFLGGVMVLFIYISSLASNENFLMSTKNSIYSFSVMFTVFILLMYFSASSNMDKSSSLQLFTSKMYSTQLCLVMVMAMLYLLLTLVIVVEIIKLYHAPLRSTQ